MSGMVGVMYAAVLLVKAGFSAGQEPEPCATASTVEELVVIAASGVRHICLTGEASRCSSLFKHVCLSGDGSCFA